MGTISALFLGCLLVVTSQAQYDDSLYDGIDAPPQYLLEELQKRLSELQGDDDAFYGQDYGVPYQWWEDLSAETRDRAMQENIREPEHLSDGSQNQGFQYISGGAGEGKQELKPEGEEPNTQEVKSDDALPFYCHPPNPCPKGFTAQDGCHDFIKDTAEEQQMWIQKSMERNLCNCDKEHMFSCPQARNTIDSEKGGDTHDSFSRILGLMDWETDKSRNNWREGNKHDQLVAKKSPIVKRSADSTIDEAAMDAELDRMAERQKKWDNPYMVGAKVSTYAKKG